MELLAALALSGGLLALELLPPLAYVAKGRLRGSLAAPDAELYVPDCGELRQALTKTDRRRAFNRLLLFKAAEPPSAAEMAAIDELQPAGVILYLPRVDAELERGLFPTSESSLPRYFLTSSAEVEAFFNASCAAGRAGRRVVKTVGKTLAFSRTPAWARIGCSIEPEVPLRASVHVLLDDVWGISRALKPRASSALAALYLASFFSRNPGRSSGISLTLQGHHQRFNGTEQLSEPNLPAVQKALAEEEQPGEITLLLTQLEPDRELEVHLCARASESVQTFAAAATALAGEGGARVLTQTCSEEERKLVLVRSGSRVLNQTEDAYRVVTLALFAALERLRIDAPDEADKLRSLFVPSATLRALTTQLPALTSPQAVADSPFVAEVLALLRLYCPSARLDRVPNRQVSFYADHTFAVEAFEAAPKFLDLSVFLGTLAWLASIAGGLHVFERLGKPAKL